MPIKWQPFKSPQGLPPFRSPFDMNDLEPGGEGFAPFAPFSRAGEPAVDIYQDKNNLYVEISLGGINPENVEVSVEDDVLIVQSAAKEEKEFKEKDYLRKEIKRSNFRRIVKLPVEVKGNKAIAEFKGGILKVTAPKAAKSGSKSTKIPIQIK